MAASPAIDNLYARINELHNDIDLLLFLLIAFIIYFVPFFVETGDLSSASEDDNSDDDSDSRDLTGYHCRHCFSTCT